MTQIRFRRLQVLSFLRGKDVVIVSLFYGNQTLTHSRSLFSYVSSQFPDFIRHVLFAKALIQRQFSVRFLIQSRKKQSHSIELCGTHVSSRRVFLQGKKPY